MSATLSAAEFEKGAQAALALLALAGAPGRATKTAAAPEAASSDASDDYHRGAAEARRLLGSHGPAGGRWRDWRAAPLDRRGLGFVASLGA